jgi:hypothetical protein
MSDEDWAQMRISVQLYYRDDLQSLQFRAAPIPMTSRFPMNESCDSVLDRLLSGYDIGFPRIIVSRVDSLDFDAIPPAHMAAFDYSCVPLVMNSSGSAGFWPVFQVLGDLTHRGCVSRRSPPATFDKLDSISGPFT